MRIAIIYIRQSGAKGDKSASLADQERDCRAIPAVAECDRIEVINEGAGKSGTLDETGRPGVAEVFARLEDPNVKILAYHERSRFTRDDTQWVAAQLNRILKRRKDIRVFDAKNVERNEEYEAIEDWVSSRYPRFVSMKMKASYAGRRDRGAWIGSTVPYGYRRFGDDRSKIEPDPERRDAVVRMFELAASGMTLVDVASILNRDKVPPPGRLGYWAPPTIAQILKHRVFVGEHKDGREAPWAPIIAAALFQRVQDRMKNFRTTGRVKREFPFRGIAYCKCGKLIWWQRNGARPFGYCGSAHYAPENRCPESKRGTKEEVLTGWMDGIVEAWESRGMALSSLTEKHESVSRMASVRIAEIDRRIASLDVRLDAGTITPERFKTELADRRRDRRALELQLAEEAPATELDGIPAQWRNGNASERRTVLASLFQSITIADGKVVGFEPRADRWARVHMLVALATSEYPETAIREVMDAAPGDEHVKEVSERIAALRELASPEP